MGGPELGYLMLSEIEDVRGKLGLPAERDLYFKAEHRLSTYVKLACHAGMIVVEIAIRRVVVTRRIVSIITEAPT